MGKLAGDMCFQIGIQILRKGNRFVVLVIDSDPFMSVVPKVGAELVTDADRRKSVHHKKSAENNLPDDKHSIGTALECFCQRPCSSNVSPYFQAIMCTLKKIK